MCATEYCANRHEAFVYVPTFEQYFVRVCLISLIS